MIHFDNDLSPEGLENKLKYFWELSAAKIDALESCWRPDQGAPVFTVQGKYATRGWTEWTQGFQFGSALLQFDATGDVRFLQMGREKTRLSMSSHLTHMGVHDHGFNNISTYGNLWRLLQEGRIQASPGEEDYCEVALKCSGAVQARRWTRLADNGGFIYSFNGPHSLFADTIRSLRSLAIAHLLGQTLLEEQDERVSLLERLVQHARATARYSVYYGEGRDSYDEHGRVAHESIFNPNNGVYRCPNTQQGYSPFTTWTRGLAWIMLGFAEELEFLTVCSDSELIALAGRDSIESIMLSAAKAASDYYIKNTPTDGIPYWDTGAPGLAKLGNYLDKPADPFNPHEPVDSSAAAIAAQGLLRLGHYLNRDGANSEGERYWRAGLRVFETLLSKPYLSTDSTHQGLILHSVYHRPKGWDYIPSGSSIPQGESSMWGDYHAREVALYLHRIIRKEPYYTFFGKGFN